MTETIQRDELFARLAPAWPADLLPMIRAQARASGRSVVVLDDDPTGTQTVYDVPVLTEWSAETLRTALAERPPALYLLTNSRSLPLAEAQALNQQIGRNLLAVAGDSAERPFVVVSRSDSTLRGHFPGEVAALAAGLGQPFDAWLLAPFFLEGGRYTIDDVHYVAEDDLLIPAGDTVFARDATFGFHASNLRAWVEEKTGGRIRAGEVASINLDDIRRGGPDRVAERLMALSGGRMCVVNAAATRDLEVVVAALLTVEARGKRFLYRTAASFVQVRAGLAPRALLTHADLQLPATGGGLVVVGSYVPKTTAQVQALLEQPGITAIEVAVAALLDERRRPGEIAHVAQSADELLRAGRDGVLYTSRQLVTGSNADHSLALGRQVSAGLIAIVRAITARPRYLLAKGGITSSDVATRALDVRRALVRGQILPGVPVWQLGVESRWPGLAYIVFPGNVGGPQALAQIVAALT
jgi:uncharacterized protein YgbK (DUF1537 family)